MFEQGQSGSSDRSTEFELANNEHWEPSRDSSAPDSSCPAVKKYRSTPPRANPPRPDILLLLLKKEREREILRNPSRGRGRRGRRILFREDRAWAFSLDRNFEEEGTERTEFEFKLVRPRRDFGGLQEGNCFSLFLLMREIGIFSSLSLLLFG